MDKKCCPISLYSQCENGRGLTNISKKNPSFLKVPEPRRKLVAVSTQLNSDFQGFLSLWSVDIDNLFKLCPHFYSNLVTPYGAYIGPTYPPSSPPPTTPPNVVIPPGPGNCDFEANLCQFTQDPTNDFDWKRGKGPTDTASTGPSFDHTHGTSKMHLL